MDGEGMSARRWIVLLGLAVEGGLVFAALLTGWLMGRDALATFTWSASDALWGLVATVPPLLVFLACLRWPVAGLRRIQQFCEEVLAPALASCSFAELALLSLLAGVGEEMLFRGVLQPACADWLGGPWLGLAAASVLFGLAHAVTFTYVVYAALMGAYLGWIWLATGNLLTVIVIHSVYDFGALIYLLHETGTKRKARASAEPDLSGSADALRFLSEDEEGEAEEGLAQ